MKERRGEKIGGGYFVFRRGKKTGRISAGGSLPFEHPSYAAASQEAERLARVHPGERFVVVRELEFADKAIYSAFSFHEELVATLEETLAVAVRNETGEFADRAQSLLKKIRGAA